MINDWDFNQDYHALEENNFNIVARSRIFHQKFGHGNDIQNLMVRKLK